MKNYKTAKKAKETQSEIYPEKPKQYMRKYRSRIKGNETEEEKQA